jgi:hypothetical protein
MQQRLFKVYNNLNLVFIGFIILLNYCKADVIPFMKVYVIADIFFLFYFKYFIKIRRVYQLTLHHLATLTLLITHDYLNKENDIHTLVHNLVILEKSTFLMILTRDFKLPKIAGYFSICVWIYYRIIYFPRLVYLAKHTWNYPQFYIPELVCLFCLEIIKNLGFVWTFEGLRLPRIYYRPLVVSITSCLTPLLVKMYQSNEILIFLNIFLLLCTSILHHSHWKYRDFIQGCDQACVIITVIHGCLLFYNNKFYLISLFTSIVFFSIARKLNQNILLRDWDNLPGLIPHIITHVSLSTCFYFSYFSF